MRCAATAAAVATILAACAQDETIAVMPPARASASAMILVVENNTSVDQVHAVDLTAPVEPIKFDAGRVDRLSALLYDDTLADLSVMPGLIPRAQPNEPSRPLPIAAASFELDEATWTEVQVRDVDYPIAAPSPCPSYTAQMISLPNSTADTLNGVALDDHTALVTLADGQWWKIDSLGRAVLVREEPIVHALFRSDEGELWILTSSGALMRGDLENGFTVTATLSSPSPDSAIDGSTGGAPFELFIMPSDDAIYRFDEASGLRLIDDVHESGGAGVDVEWVGPGEAIAIGTRARTIVRYKEGVAAPEEFQNIFNAELPMSIVHHPTLGSFLGSDGGYLYRKKAGTGWEVIGGLGSEAFGAPIESLEPYGDAIMIGLGRGTVSSYYDGFPPCPNVDFGRNHTREIVIMGEHILLIPNFAIGEPTPFYVTMLTPSP